MSIAACSCYRSATSSGSTRSTSTWTRWAIPTPPDSFTVTMSLGTPYASGDALYVEAIGGWGYHPFTAAELPAPDMGAVAISAGETYAPYDGTTGAGFVPWSGRPLDAITTADTLIGLHYRGNELIERRRVSGVRPRARATSISETMVALTTAPLDVTVHPATVAQRARRDASRRCRRLDELGVRSPRRGSRPRAVSGLRSIPRRS